MTEHTALPLELIAHSDGTYIIDADGEIFNDDSFIVTACNCHDGLLEICERILRFDEKGFINLKPALHNDLQREIRKARSV